MYVCIIPVSPYINLDLLVWYLQRYFNIEKTYYTNVMKHIVFVDYQNALFQWIFCSHERDRKLWLLG